MSLLFPSEQRGSVLIVVMWICLGLASLTVVFGHSMMMTYRGVDNELAARQADQAIDGAVRYLQTEISAAKTSGTALADGDYQAEEVAVGDAFFWIIGRHHPGEDPTRPAFRIIDEASKLNVNTASIGMLSGIPGMPAELAAAIVDWRDQNDDISRDGAESETYLLYAQPYAAKNSPFETLDEIALVNGADPAVLYGEDANHNGILDPNENDGNQSPPDDNADGKLDRGVLDYLTVYSREPNRRSDGSPRINLNQRSSENALKELFRTKIGVQRSEDILRQARPGSRNFRSVLEYAIQSAMKPDELDKVYDDLSITDDAVVSGLVNVNTASEEVLQCIPGIDQTRAESLIAARLKQSSPPPSPAWIIEILGAQRAITAARFLTTKSWQYEADIAAVGRHQRGYRRAEVVMDFMEDLPRVVYRRNLTPLGWVLGVETHQQLLTQSTQP